jgi:hypothetical protein
MLSSIKVINTHTHSPEVYDHIGMNAKIAHYVNRIVRCKSEQTD